VLDLEVAVGGACRIAPLNRIQHVPPIADGGVGQHGRGVARRRVDVAGGALNGLGHGLPPHATTWPTWARSSAVARPKRGTPRTMAEAKLLVALAMVTRGRT